MAKHIVFLRGINVSGKNSIKMQDLRSLLTEAGFEEVMSYIQSGNIILSSPLSKQEVKSAIHQLIQEKLGLDIEVFAVTGEELNQVLLNNPFQGGHEQPNKLFITFLSNQPSTDLVNKLQEKDHGQEEFQLINNMLYFYLPEGMAKSKMNNSYFEKALKVKATGRNLNTVQKLISLIQ
ncbi:DUF1697 domain-containing protein [Sphingobacterium olei]|uniref:DUF1697 domain-containing protein n=1 Tax=Sphingobacterium olei TaxID=2571155 RepID=UPI001EE4540B|nr:DUF1697 domain-containing protein [Sphingobacterium olei]